MGGSSIKCWEEGHGFISENYILKRGAENWKIGSKWVHVLLYYLKTLCSMVILSYQIEMDGKFCQNWSLPPTPDY